MTALPEYLQQAANIYRLEQARAQSQRRVWQPNDGAQRRAFESGADVIGYGGSAGGGKTDLLLGKALTQHYRAAIYRRHYPDLADIITRGDEILDGRAQFVHGEKKRWALPGGAFVTLGAVQHQKDLRKFQGRARDFIGIDEAAEFPEDWFRYLTGWLRTTKPDQRTQIVLTFNPPTTPEGEWVVRYFAPWLDERHPDPAAPGELRYFIRVNDEDVEVADATPVDVDGIAITPQSRTFIPARVDDNPHLTNDYKSQLNSLPEPLRSQLLFGDFSVTANDDVWQVIPTQWVLDAQQRWREGQRPDVEMRALGSDPARGGKDRHAIATLYGTWFELAQHAGAQTPDGVAAANQIIAALGEADAPVFVDVIGIGASVYDQLAAIDSMGVTGINVASSPSPKTATDKSGKYGFANLRSQMIWQFREALEPGSGEAIALPDTRELRLDLTAPKYKIVGGKIKIEAKDDIKKRMGRSPDDGDAVMLAWHGAAHGQKAPFIWLDW